jgi:hypothetical protein
VENAWVNTHVAGLINAELTVEGNDFSKHKMVMHQKDNATLFLFDSRMSNVQRPAVKDGLNERQKTADLRGGWKAHFGIARKFTTQGWIGLILWLLELDGVWVLAIENGDDPAQEVEVKCIPFDTPVDIVIEQCESMSVPTSEESPVALGPFALLSLPLEPHERNALIASTLDWILSRRPKRTCARFSSGWGTCFRSRRRSRTATCATGRWSATRRRAGTCSCSTAPPSFRPPGTNSAFPGS